MMREEFEAVIAIEGKYLEVRPEITRKGVTWNALVWEWYDPVKDAMHPYAKSFLKGMGFDKGPVQRTLAASYAEPTNLKAIKVLMRHWEQGDF